MVKKGEKDKKREKMKANGRHAGGTQNELWPSCDIPLNMVYTGLVQKIGEGENLLRVEFESKSEDEKKKKKKGTSWRRVGARLRLGKWPEQPRRVKMMKAEAGQNESELTAKGFTTY